MTSRPRLCHLHLGDGRTWAAIGCGQWEFPDPQIEVIYVCIFIYIYIYIYIYLYLYIYIYISHPLKTQKTLFSLTIRHFDFKPIHISLEAFDHKPQAYNLYPQTLTPLAATALKILDTRSRLWPWDDGKGLYGAGSAGSMKGFSHMCAA